MATESILATQLTIGTLSAGLLQYLKSAEWAPFINKHSKAINHGILLLTSALGAIGIGYVWSPTEHSLTITGLSLATIAIGLWTWLKQWVLQFLVHKGMFGNVSQPPLIPAPKE